VIVLRAPGSWTPIERSERLRDALALLTSTEVDGAIVVAEPARVRVFRS
jgi:hypothetical protein